MGCPEISTANAWRWKYPRPPDVHSPGVDAAHMLRDTLIVQRSKQSRQEQVKLKRETGFPGGKAEIGHAVGFELRRQGYSRTTAQLGAHLAAVSGSWNFQGNRRLAFWVGVSERTVRRHRLRLEQDGWIASCLLHPGDQILGQRAPVVRPQVVRDVTKLQRLASVRTAARVPRHKRQQRPSAAEQPVAPGGAMTAEDFDELARRNPELAAQFNVMAAARRNRPKREPRPEVPPPNACETPSPELIDHWDQVTAAYETELDERALLEWYARNGLDPPDSLK